MLRTFIRAFIHTDIIKYKGKYYRVKCFNNLYRYHSVSYHSETVFNIENKIVHIIPQLVFKG